jgi:hypothetical protein
MQPYPAEMSATIGASEFDTATTSTRRPGLPVYDLNVDAGWTVGPKPNGGYLLAALVRAAADEVVTDGADHPHPLAATAHFMRAPDPGPAEIAVQILRLGHGASQARATLSQAGRACVDVVVTLGRLEQPDRISPPWWTGPDPFEVAPPESCHRMPSAPPGSGFTIPVMDRADTRLDPACLGFAFGQPTGRGELKGWISLADGRPADPYSLLFFLDALPPATFDLAPTGWVPTLSLTAYVRSWPAPGPLRVRQYVQSVHHDRIDEVCELWDSAGHLVGQATQLAAIRFPEGAEPPPKAAPSPRRA